MDGMTISHIVSLGHGSYGFLDQDWGVNQQLLVFNQQLLELFGTVSPSFTNQEFQLGDPKMWIGLQV